MFLLVPAHPGCPGQIPQRRKTVVCVCVLASAHARVHTNMHMRTHAHTHTHTHTNHFTALLILSGTTRVSQHQKGKTNLDLLEQEIVSGSGISWAICKSAP